jgi:hypothetical protein
MQESDKIAPLLVRNKLRANLNSIILKINPNLREFRCRSSFIGVQLAAILNEQKDAKLKQITVNHKYPLVYSLIINSQLAKFVRYEV